MKYLILGLVTEAGQQLPGPDLEAWMQEHEWDSLAEMRGNMSFLKVPDPDQLDSVDKVKTIRVAACLTTVHGVKRRSSPATRCSRPDTIDEAVEISKTLARWTAA
jgi:hypothetical protein